MMMSWKTYGGMRKNNSLMFCVEAEKLRSKGLVSKPYAL